MNATTNVLVNLIWKFTWDEPKHDYDLREYDSKETNPESSLYKQKSCQDACYEYFGSDIPFKTTTGEQDDDTAVSNNIFETPNDHNRLCPVKFEIKQENHDTEQENSTDQFNESHFDEPKWENRSATSLNDMPDLVDEHEEILKAPIRVACQNEDETELIRRYNIEH